MDATTPQHVHARAILSHLWGRVMLLSLLGFLGVTETVGGIGILLNWWPLDEGWLAGSVFSTYTVPGIALFGVGVISLGALLLVLRNHPLAHIASVLAALAISVYETVEVFVVPFHWLQVFYMTVGLFVVLLVSGARTTRRPGDRSLPLVGEEHCK